MRLTQPFIPLRFRFMVANPVCSFLVSIEGNWFKICWSRFGVEHEEKNNAFMSSQSKFVPRVVDKKSLMLDFSP